MQSRDINNNNNDNNKTKSSHKKNTYQNEKFKRIFLNPQDQVQILNMRKKKAMRKASRYFAAYVTYVITFCMSLEWMGQTYIDQTPEAKDFYAGGDPDQRCNLVQSVKKRIKEIDAFQENIRKSEEIQRQNPTKVDAFKLEQDRRELPSHLSSRDEYSSFLDGLGHDLIDKYCGSRVTLLDRIVAPGIILLLTIDQAYKRYHHFNQFEKVNAARYLTMFSAAQRAKRLQNEIALWEKAANDNQFLAYVAFVILIAVFGYTIGGDLDLLAMVSPALLLNLFIPNLFEIAHRQYESYQNPKLESDMKKREKALSSLLTNKNINRFFELTVLKNTTLETSYFKVSCSNGCQNKNGSIPPHKLIKLFMEALDDTFMQTLTIGSIPGEKTSLIISADFNPRDIDEIIVNEFTAKLIKTMFNYVPPVVPLKSPDVNADESKIPKLPNQDFTAEKNKKTKQTASNENDKLRYQGVTTIFSGGIKKTPNKLEEISEESNVISEWVLDDEREITLDARKLENEKNPEDNSLYIYFDSAKVEREKVERFQKVADSAILVPGAAKGRNCVHELDKEYDIYSLKISDDDRVLGTVIGHARDDQSLKIIYFCLAIGHTKQDEKLRDPESFQRELYREALKAIKKGEESKVQVVNFNR